MRARHPSRDRAARRRRRAAAALGVAATAVAGATAAALVGCPSQSSSTLPYTPITGIEISAESLEYGHDCSDAADALDAVYRYAAIVSYAYDGGSYDGGFNYGLQWSNVFECFADGFFENIPVIDGGNQLFSIQIWAWNAATFPSTIEPCTAETWPDGATKAITVPDGQSPALCPAQRPSDVEMAVANPSSAPQWFTTCTAYMQPNIPAVAACAPLQPFEAEVADAGPAVESGIADAAAEALPEASAQAPEASED